MPELVGRHKRLSFAKVEETYHRMTKFTSLSDSKSAIEYSRQYVDMATESTDVVGYAASIGYSYDRHTDTPVHEFMSKVADDEMMGEDAHIDIVTVDLFKPVADNENECEARLRTYAIIPDGSGDGTDALIYTGNLKAVSVIEKGVATTTDGWKTITFQSSAE